jgi:RHS repeat-associated protein
VSAHARTCISQAAQSLPSWALLGEYDNGSASGAGRVEYIWLPTDDGSAIPVAMFRGSRYWSIHSDHLGTPSLIKDDAAKPTWQWAYSAFGDNKPTGILKATTNPNAAITNQPTLLQATGAMEFNLRFPGQYLDQETGQFYNYFRTYQPNQGAYSQMDPKGLAAGWNRRVYVEGNPLSYTDPTGLDRYYDPAWGGGAGQGWWWNMPRQNDTPYAPPGFQPPPSVTLPWPGNGAPPANAEYRGWRPETPRDQDQIVTRAMCTAMAAGLGIGFPYSTPASQACAAMVNKIPRNTCPGGDTFHGAP